MCVESDHNEIFVSNAFLRTAVNTESDETPFTLIRHQNLPIDNFSFHRQVLPCHTDYTHPRLQIFEIISSHC